jgi:hypothetical protein
VRYIAFKTPCCVDGNSGGAVLGTSDDVAEAKAICTEATNSTIPVEYDHVVVIDSQSGDVIPWWDIV